MKKLLLVIGLMLYSVQPLYAVDYQTGNDLVNKWQEYKKAHEGKPYSIYDEGAFMGYVNGVAETAPFIIYPKSTTIGQLCSVVGTWIEAHPEKWTDAPLDIVTTALKEAFSLQKKSK